MISANHLFLIRVVTETHVLLGCASFFTVAFGGLAIGIRSILLWVLWVYFAMAYGYFHYFTINVLFLLCYLSPVFYSESVCKFNVPHESFTRVPITGLTFGLLTAVITKFTSGVRVLEPLALLGGSYLAYVVAELFHWYVVISLLHLYHPNQFFCIPTTCLAKV